MHELLAEVPHLAKPRLARGGGLIPAGDPLLVACQLRVPITLVAADDRARRLRVVQRRVLDGQPGTLGRLLDLIELRPAVHVLSHHVQPGAAKRVKGPDDLQRIPRAGIRFAQRHGGRRDHIAPPRAPDPRVAGWPPKAMSRSSGNTKLVVAGSWPLSVDAGPQPDLARIRHIDPDADLHRRRCLVATQIDPRDFALIRLLRGHAFDDEFFRVHLDTRRQARETAVPERTADFQSRATQIRDAGDPQSVAEIEDHADRFRRGFPGGRRDESMLAGLCLHRLSPRGNSGAARN